MGHGKETPRQKMIGMMYLVLMAMLALNVSNEVLNAFDVLDAGLQRTKETLHQANITLIGQLESNEDKAKVAPWLEKATQVRERADALVGLIQDMKIEILEHADENEAINKTTKEIDATKIKKRDNTAAPAFIMVGDNNDKEGKKLKEEIEKYRNFLTEDIIDQKLGENNYNQVMAALSTAPNNAQREETGGSTGLHTWERQNFEHLPMSGVLVIMSGLQINVRNAESEALKYLLSRVGEGDVSFNKVEAAVLPNSGYVIEDENYNASIFLAAYDDRKDPVVWVTESASPYDSIFDSEANKYFYTKKDGLQYRQLEAHDGRGFYNVVAKNPGIKRWGGIIEYQTAYGVVSYPFKEKYQVAQKFVSVAPTKMNVFYVGVQNPVDVSVAGVPSDRVDIQVTNAKLSKKGNSYYIIPNRPGNSWVTVFANINGKKREIDKKEFRVKVVPTPVVTINNQKSGSIKRQLMKALPGPVAVMEDFLFDLNFTITEFTLAGFDTRGFFREVPTKGKVWSADQIQLMDALQLNRTFYIQDVKAVGPGGTTRPLQTANFKLIE